MLSCAAIQKLERYGQLGHKRSTVEDFVLSSLADTRRANIYALTHSETWKQCLDAMSVADEDQTAEEIGMAAKKSAPVPVTEGLVHAMSFATALLSYHVQPSKDASTTSYVFEPTECAKGTPAAVILSLLKKIALCIAKEEKGLLGGGSGGSVRTTPSAVFTQALGHLLGSVTVLLYCVLSRILQAKMDGASTRFSTQITDAELQTMWNDGLVLHSAVCRQLRRAMAQFPDETLISARPCPTVMKQYFTKLQQKQKNNTKPMPKVAPTTEAKTFNGIEEHPMLQLLLATTEDEGRNYKTCLGAFAAFGLFQKLSLLYAILGDVRTNSFLRTLEHNAADGTPYASRSTIVQQLLRNLLSSIACNRATRFVVYYRSDDLKLMQNNVRQPSEYALHTFATTPPIEDSLVESCLTLKDPAVKQHVALLLAQWIASLPYFFECFCTDPSWGSFAQEQRRMALLRQAQERRGRRDERRKKKDTSAGSASSRAASVSSNASSAGSSSADGVDGDDDRDDMMSVASQNTTNAPSMRSMVSLESRASLLSNMSKRSAASYMSFISVLRPEGVDAEGEAEAAKLHESADGNTNLPLILLEELVLALHQFMEVFPAEFLDAYGLRALCWRSIGHLFAFVQSTITSASQQHDEDSSSSITQRINNNTASDVASLFNLGQDIRFNHGLGYEVLGLLFAKVIAPQLEGASPADGEDEHHVTRSLVGRTLICPEDAPLTKKSVEESLSACLAAYEMVAPQVVDMNLPVVLRIAARTAVSGAAGSASSSSSMVLYEFLSDVILRLGKSNQIVALLDALVEAPSMPASTAPLHDDAEELVAIHTVVSHPVVRKALVQACQLSMDPENILSHVTAYVEPWTSDASDFANEGEEPEVALSKYQKEAAHVVFILQLVSTVLEGISPTSVTSSAVLEKSTELEMLLVAFAEKNLRDDANEDADTTQQLFNPPLRGKQRRHLWLHALFAVYQCREVTSSCLMDLGLQNIDAYISMLDETLWQVGTSVGSILGSMTYDDLESTMSATTHMSTAPYTHARVLLPQLVLQRLSLARAVCTALATEAAPQADARAMASYVLSTLGEDHSNTEDRARILCLANLISESEWSSLVAYAKRKHVRQCLVSLLRVTFRSGASTEAGFAPEVYSMPLWLKRCLRSAGGAVLRAITDVFVSLPTEEVALYACDDASEDSEARSLPVMLCALEHVYSCVGRVPYWPALLAKTTECIASISKRSQAAKKKKGGQALRALLIRFMGITLTFEPNCTDAMRRVLVAMGNQEAASLTKTSGGNKGLSRQYVECVGVPLTSLNELNEEQREDDAEGQVVVNDWCFEEELRDMTKRTFSSSFIVTLLEDGTEEAMRVLARLYQMCLATLASAWRERRVQTLEDLSKTAPATFIIETTRLFHGALQVHSAEAARHEKLLTWFLQALPGAEESGSNTSLLVPQLPQSQKQKKETTTDNKESSTGASALEAVEDQWVDTLRHRTVAILSSNGKRSDTSTGQLRHSARCFTVLCSKVFASYARSHPLKQQKGDDAKNKKRSRSDANVKQSSDAATPAVDESKTSSIMASIAKTLTDTSASEVAKDLNALLQSFFSTENQDGSKSMTSYRAMVDLVANGDSEGVEVLWILFKLYESLLRHRRAGELTAVPATTLAALFSLYDPESPTKVAAAMQARVSSASTKSAETGKNTDAAFRSDSAAAASGSRTSPCASASSVAYYKQCLQAVPRVLHLLRADNAPAPLHLFLHALLNESIPSSSNISHWLLGPATTVKDVSMAPLQNLVAAHELLVAAAEALKSLSQVPGMRYSALKNHLERLLWVSTLPCFRLLRKRISPTTTLWSVLLANISVPSRALHQDKSFLDTVWAFLGVVLDINEDTAATTVMAEHTITGALTEVEVMQITVLLSRTWLPLGILWHRPEMLPNLMSAIFACILRGVRDGRYERRVLNQFSSFIFQLVRHAEGAATQDEAKASNSITANAMDAENRSSKKRKLEDHTGTDGSADTSSSSMMASTPTRLLSLASIAAAMFQVSRHYITVFTAYSSDLDFVAADLLRVLSHHRLPRMRAAPIAYHDDVVIVDPGRSNMTLSDLVFTSVGEEESKSLLRQAALRLEEDDTDILVGERRHIFRVS